MIRVPLSLLCVVFFGGCAVGVKHQYDNITPETKFQTRAKIAVGVHDQRSYVVNGQKTPTFVGLSRGGFGNPFDVNTASGQPLANDFRNSIASGLSKAGANIARVDLSQTVKPEEALRLMRGAGADKALLVTIDEWKVDTFSSVNLNYELRVVVLGPSGQLALKRLSGDEQIGSSLMNPVGTSREVAPVAYKKKLEEILSDPAIARALQ